MIGVASLIASLLAQGGAGGGSPEFPWGQTLIYVALIFGLLWLFLIRPQQQRESQERDMLTRLKKNDKVVTKCGMLGVVMNVKDNEVVLKVDEQNNTKVRFRRDAIAAIIDDKKDDKKDEKTDAKEAGSKDTTSSKPS
jgi:preprotein translocase subunit YajC